MPTFGTYIMNENVFIAVICQLNCNIQALFYMVPNACETIVDNKDLLRHRNWYLFVRRIHCSTLLKGNKQTLDVPCIRKLTKVMPFFVIID